MKINLQYRAGFPNLREKSWCNQEFMIQVLTIHRIVERHLLSRWWWGHPRARISSACLNPNKAGRRKTLKRWMIINSRKSGKSYKMLSEKGMPDLSNENEELPQSLREWEKKSWGAQTSWRVFHAHFLCSIATRIRWWWLAKANWILRWNTLRRYRRRIGSS